MAKVKFEWNLEEIMPAVMCSCCKKVPGSDKEANKRYTCLINTHVLCESCTQVLGDNNCPYLMESSRYCWSQVSSLPSSAIEKLMDGIPLCCPNYSHGCRDVFSDDSRLQMHLKDCLYRSIPCVFQFTSVCSEKVIYKNWYDHAQSHVLWKTFKFMVEAEIADDVSRAIDPDWVPPMDLDEVCYDDRIHYGDTTDEDSDISEDSSDDSYISEESDDDSDNSGDEELKELLKSKDKKLDEILKKKKNSNWPSCSSPKMDYENGVWSYTSVINDIREKEMYGFWPLEILRCGSETFVFQYWMDSGDIFDAWIICMESSIDAKNYEYTITANGKGGEKVHYRGVCTSPENFEEDEIKEKGLVFSMRRATTEYFADEENILRLDITITNLKEQAKDVDMESGISDNEAEDSSK